MRNSWSFRRQRHIKSWILLFFSPLMQQSHTPSHLGFRSPSHWGRWCSITTGHLLCLFCPCGCVTAWRALCFCFLQITSCQRMESKAKHALVVSLFTLVSVSSASSSKPSCTSLPHLFLVTVSTVTGTRMCVCVSAWCPGRVLEVAN